jgi:hypothetical protein
MSVQTFSTIRDFMHFVNWYDGCLTLIKNKAYDNDTLVAQWLKNE